MSATKRIVLELLQSARAAAPLMASAETSVKNRALRLAAEALSDRLPQIVQANGRDLEAGRKAGLSAAMLDRLLLDRARVNEMAAGLRDVARLPDPVGRKVRSWTRPNGLRVSLVRIPLGVIVMIYEARPNVTIDAAGLCLKSGNVAVLRGGKEALRSSLALAEAMSEGIVAAGLPGAAVQVLPIRDRAAVRCLVQADGLVDLVIPRGGEGLIRRVTAEARVPVLKHYKGVCHVYLDASAPLRDSIRIVLNSKVQRPGVCNAAETLLVHAKAAPKLLPAVAAALQEQGVELRGCERTCALAPFAKPARPEDYGFEFLDLIMAVRVVDSLDQAIEHIRQYGSDHTEAIVTRDAAAAERFLDQVRSSTVLSNASTRFADGGQLGLGAEIGISTTRLHAYGPMGLEALTVPRFVVRGNGQIRG